MVHVKPVKIDEDHQVVAIEAKLPETNLMVVTTEKGYIMCGALDIEVLNGKLPEREIIAARALGVKTIDELLDAPLESVTKKAEEIGVKEGMKARDALKKMM